MKELVDCLTVDVWTAAVQNVIPSCIVPLRARDAAQFQQVLQVRAIFTLHSLNTGMRFAWGSLL